MAVIHSGTTVAVGLLALVALPVPFLRSVGFGGMLIPLVSVPVAITLLPVVLATVGPWLDWPRRRREAHVSHAWTAWARMVIRRRGSRRARRCSSSARCSSRALPLNLGDPQADARAKTGDAHDGLVALGAGRHRRGRADADLCAGAPADADAVAARLAQISDVRAALAPNDPAWRRDGTALITVLAPADANSARAAPPLIASASRAHAAQRRRASAATRRTTPISSPRSTATSR